MRELEKTIENLKGKARNQIREAEEKICDKLAHKEKDFIKKTEELDRVLKE